MSIRRPIMCLNTSYKLMTSVLSEILMKHVMAYYLLPVEQRALWRGQRGCLDVQLLDAAAEGTLARPAKLPRCTAPGRRSRGHSGEAA